jgi:hypothetical protein
MSVSALEFRSRRGSPQQWPRNALREERQWLNSLGDRELAEHCAALHAIDRAVRDFRGGPEPPKDIAPLLDDPKRAA